MKKMWLSSSVNIGKLMLVLAAVGLLASFTLLHDTIEYVKNPSYQPACNVNPIISCTSAMGSAVAETIPGIPNPAVGLAAFGALAAFAVLLWAGVKVPKKIWLAGVGVAGAGVLFVIFLYVYSLTTLHTVCPWCFVTWLTTIAIFWALVTHSLREKYLVLPKSLAPAGQWWSQNAGLVLAIFYAVIIFIILAKFNQSLFA
jgi:uncharacterized membrane protein